MLPLGNFSHWITVEAAGLEPASPGRRQKPATRVEPIAPVFAILAGEAAKVVGVLVGWAPRQPRRRRRRSVVRRKRPFPAFSLVRATLPFLPSSATLSRSASRAESVTGPVWRRIRWAGRICGLGIWPRLAGLWCAGVDLRIPRNLVPGEWESVAPDPGRPVCGLRVWICGKLRPH
jgi:hypothetical protein